MAIKPEDPCGICAGEGTPTSGLPCVCGGSGLHADEVEGLRILAHNSERLIADYEHLLKGYGLPMKYINKCRKARDFSLRNEP